MGDAGSEMMKMYVPNDKVGLIIGRGGATIKNIRDESGTRIKVTDDNDDSGNRLVIIWGNEQQQGHAKGLIDQVCASDRQ